MKKLNSIVDDIYNIKFKYYFIEEREKYETS